MRFLSPLKNTIAGVMGIVRTAHVPKRSNKIKKKEKMVTAARDIMAATVLQKRLSKEKQAIATNNLCQKKGVQDVNPYRWS